MLTKTYLPLLEYHLSGNPKPIRVFAETQPGTKLEDIASDIFHGEFSCSRIIAVYAIEENEPTIDVSSAIVKAIVERVIKGEHPSSLAVKFVNNYGDIEDARIFADFQDDMEF